jgi:hypothetical protein
MIRSIYVAAPYRNAGQVRAVHRALERVGLRPTSRWAEVAGGAEDLEAMSIAVRERARLENHEAIERADALLVLADTQMGETLVEVGVAIARGVPIVWVDGLGKLPLSAACPAVCTRVPDVAAAIAWLGRRMRRAS